MTPEERGRLGGKASAEALSAQGRAERSAKGGRARWGRVRSRPCPVCGGVLGTGKLAMHEGVALAHEGCAVRRTA
jgi:hypothetical protein